MLKNSYDLIEKFVQLQNKEAVSESLKKFADIITKEEHGAFENMLSAYNKQLSGLEEYDLHHFLNGIG